MEQPRGNGQTGAAPPGAAPIPIDILFPVHGRPELTIRNVKAIFERTTVPFHLIVLDDTDASIEQGSFHPVLPSDITSPFFERLVREHDNITYHNHPHPFPNGNNFFNVGFAFCKHDYVATIMNSLTVEPGWELHAIELFRTIPELGVVGFKNLFPNGTIESAGIIFNNFTPCDYARDAPGHALTMDIEMPAVQWAFALLRRKAVVGNLQEDIFHGFVGWDDIDNCMAIRSKGWKVMYCGHGAGTHQPRATRGSDAIEASLKNKANALTFYKRWGFWKQYQEANKLDVSYKLKPETKEKLTTIVLELQVLQTLTHERQEQLKIAGGTAMKELGVEPDKFNLEMNPHLNLWSLIPVAEPLDVTKPVLSGASPSDGNKDVSAVVETKEEIKT